jgi:hypothetical protein
MSLIPSRILLFVLGLQLVGTAGSGAATDAEFAVPWQSGLLEVNHYTLEVEGELTGEIEQRLYGEEVDGTRRYRVTYHLMRQVGIVNGQPVTGHMHNDLVFRPAGFEMLQRIDRFAVGTVEGQVTYTRTPDGFRVLTESTDEGIPREPDENEVVISGPPPVVDQLLLVYLIRSLPLEEGHQFQVSAYSPALNGTRRLRGKVGGRQTFDWEGEEVVVQRIESSSPDGVTTYYVTADGSRRLLRWADPDGVNYSLQRQESE